MEKTLNVTLVVWQGLSAILPEKGRGVGGLEVCAWRLAKGLTSRPGIQTRIIVRAPGGLKSQNIDGVQVVFVNSPREYVRRDVSVCIDFSQRKLKRFSWKLLWQVPYLAMTWPFREVDPPPMEPDPRLSNADTDVWITFGSSREAAGVAATAQSQNKPLLLMLQSNADLDERYVRDPTYRSAYGEIGAHCLFAIRHATKIACQTKTQASLLKDHFGREGVIVRNLTEPSAFRAAVSSPGDYVLWIGRYDKIHKRPHFAIEVAKRCPDIQFRMIVNESDDQVRREIQAFRPSNVELIDYVPFDQQPELFGNARVFFSTGSAEYEGFPTVLLQAVAAGKPIVSMDDFDNFIQESQSGQVVGEDFQHAAEAIQAYWDTPASHDANFAHQYLETHHTLGAITTQVEGIIRELCEQPQIELGD